MAFEPSCADELDDIPTLGLLLEHDFDYFLRRNERAADLDGQAAIERLERLLVERHKRTVHACHATKSAESSLDLVTCPHRHRVRKCRYDPTSAQQTPKLLPGRSGRPSCRIGYTWPLRHSFGVQDTYVSSVPILAFTRLVPDLLDVLARVHITRDVEITFGTLFDKIEDGDFGSFSGIFDGDASSKTSASSSSV